MAQIDVQTEQEDQRGWWYHVLVIESDGREHTHDVRLDWLDHEHWSGGRVAPSRVIEELFASLSLEPELIPGRFDASTARRWIPNLDDRLHARFAASDPERPGACGSR